MTIFGHSPAVVVIEKLQVNHDVIWKKTWATLDCVFVKPARLEGEKLPCFIEVPDNFSFGRFREGDRLKFRYQQFDFGTWKKEDPRVILLEEFFDLKALPNKYDDGSFTVVQ